MIPLFVNTTNTPGGDGTTSATIGTHRAFASLAEGLGPFHLTTLANPYRFLCVGGVADTDSLDHTPWEFVTTPTNCIEVWGDNTTGKWNQNAYHIAATNRHALYNQYAAHVKLYNLQIEITVTDGADHDAFRLSTANNDTTNGAGYFLFQDCIARTGAGSTNGTVRGFINSILGAGSGDVDIVNCLMIGRGTSTDIGFNDGDANAWTQAHVRYYNCTAATCVFGFEDGIFVNCLATGCLFGFIGSLYTGSDYNATDDGNGISAGTHNNDNVTPFTFINAAGGDYHLASTDAGARGLGLTDPSGTGLGSADIDGQARTGSWDIGCDQYVAATAAARQRLMLMGMGG